MKKSIMKGTTSFHVSYTNGGFSNNLLGKLFTIETVENEITLSIDLAPNVRTRNKQTNSYYDAVELSENYQKLKYIQIHEGIVLDALQAEWEKAENPKVLLSLSIDKFGTFVYHVHPEKTLMQVQLNVLTVL